MMRKYFLLTLFLSISIYSFGINPNFSLLKVEKENVPLMLSDTSSQNIDSMAICVLNGWLNFLDSIFTSNCLPRNEARESELNSGNLQSDFFVPAQLGYWMLTSISAYDAAQIYPNLEINNSQIELITKLHCAMGALENILDHHAFVDTFVFYGTGKKALYQVHKINGIAPKSNSFERTVSMLDNLYLITALEITKNWAQSTDTSLVNRIQGVLDQFDLDMWQTNSYEFHLGGDQNPREGSKIDRIVSEGRLIYPISFARGNIELNDFVNGMDSLRSNPQSNPIIQNISVEFLPFFGTALEKWVPTSILSTEIKTRFGQRTLKPLITAQEAYRCQNMLAGIEATGIANNGVFSLWRVSPFESSDTSYLNKNILIPSAISMLSGAMAKEHPLAVCNFENMIKILYDLNQLNSEWGPLNILGCDSGLVDISDPTRSTLEIGQGASSLLNMILGGNYFDSLLRLNPAYNEAINNYAAALDNRIIIKEAEIGGMGSGIPRSRGSAWSKKSWWLKNEGDTITYEVDIKASGDYLLELRYSNDNGSPINDSLIILVNNSLKKKIGMPDTRVIIGSPGSGWDNFLISDTVNLGSLPIGKQQISIVLDQVFPANNGLEIDALIIKGNFEYDNLYDPEIKNCCSSKPTSTNTGSDPALLFEVIIFPNPFAYKTNISIFSPQPTNISLTVFDINGKQVASIGKFSLRSEFTELEWRAPNLSAGIYFLKIKGNNWVKTEKLIIQK